MRMCLNLGHAKVIFLFLFLQVTKNDQATRLLVWDQSGKNMVYKQQNASWRVKSLHKTTKCRDTYDQCKPGTVSALPPPCLGMRLRGTCASKHELYFFVNNLLPNFCM